MADREDDRQVPDHTARRERFALALLSSATIRDACKAVELPERTGYRWVHHDEDFKRILAEAKRAVLEHGLARLKNAFASGVSVLMSLANNNAVEPKDRITAASKLCDLNLKGIELEDIRDRLERLEGGQ